VAPAVLDLLPARPAQPAALFALAAGEVAAGLALGLLLRLFVLALQIAGTIAAQAAMLTQLLGPVPGMDPSPAMGQLLVWAGLGLAATLGLHLQVAAYLIQGYALLPPGAVLDPGALLAVGVGEVGRSFALAFTLAAPFVAASLLANLVLGFINRAMPQLMVTFVGAPALIFGGLALLFLAAPIMLAAWIVAFGAALAAPFGGAP
jgi:flagellar biosynthetic protein FliR